MKGTAVPNCPEYSKKPGEQILEKLLLCLIDRISVVP